METILLTRNDLTSGVEIPADVRKMLSFIANWDDDCELALWFNDTEVCIYQPQCGMWTLFEAMKFKLKLVAADIVTDCCTFLFSSETIRSSSCDCGEHVAALCIRRAYIK